MAHDGSTWREARDTGDYDPLNHWFVGATEENGRVDLKRVDENTLIPHLLQINKSSTDVHDDTFINDLKKLYNIFKMLPEISEELKSTFADRIDNRTIELISENFNKMAAQLLSKKNLFVRITEATKSVTYPFFVNPKQVELVKLATRLTRACIEANDLKLTLRTTATGMPYERGRRSNIKPMPPTADFPKHYDTIIVVIDVDIAFAHQRFWHSASCPKSYPKSRIAWFWDQDASSLHSAGEQEETHFGFGQLNATLGREMFHSEITDYITDAKGEKSLYESYVRDSYTGVDVPLPPSVYAHGTHVLDVAAGGEDDTTGIFAVQLPREAVAETRGVSSLTPYILAALERIDKYADQIAGDDNERPKVLVNISVGGHAGRHDGFTIVEQHLDWMLENGLLDGIFISAGNSYDTKTHARFKASDLRDGGGLLKWRIQPDDGTASFLEIWLPEKTPMSDIAIQQAENRPLRLWITPPGGSTKQFDFDDLKPGQYFEYTHLPAGTTDEVVLARLYIEENAGIDFSQGTACHKPRRRLVLAVRHTKPYTTATGGYVGGFKNLAGDWDIRMEAAIAFPDDKIAAVWIYRDEEIVRQRNGARQSFFVDGSGTKIGAISNEGTISDIASGRLSSIIAAHVSATREPTGYSSEGINMVNSVTKRDVHPTASAAAEVSTAHPGILAAGFFSGSTWRLGGTSVASPLALREVKENLHDHRLLNSPRSVLVHLANQDEAQIPEKKISTSRIGQGRLKFRRDKANHASGINDYPERRR